MIKVDATKFKTKPFSHQLEGVNALVNNPFFALYDECGAGKTFQVVNAACILAEAGEIDTVVVVCPASVRTVWIDREIGEIKKHAWRDSAVFEFHSKLKQIWCTSEARHTALVWMVTNYEFLRSEVRIKQLFKCFEEGRKVLLVCDESSYIKSRTAAQTKAVMKLRQYCKRCVILNGTPITNSPLDLFSQMKVLSPKILGDNFYAFRAQYAVIKHMRFGSGRSFQQVVSYQNLEELQKRVAPYVLRRLKKDVLDLPEKLYTQREVPLSVSSWKRYQELKRDAIVALGNGDTQLEPNAAVRIMRLAQLTSGHIGRGPLASNNEDYLAVEVAEMATEYQDLSSEKLDWAVQYLTEECQARYVIVWCRWRRERERLTAALALQKEKCVHLRQLYGGQPKQERQNAIDLFSQLNTCVNDNGWINVLIAQQHAGGHGLNLVAATEEIFLSNDFSWGIRAQAEDRAHRQGQKHNVLIIDVLAVSPKYGQTIDHTILKALRAKENLANWTASAWRKELGE